MLTDVISIVCRVEYVRVVQLSGVFELSNKPRQHLIDGLESPETLALVMIIVCDDCVVELGEVLDPTDTTRYRGVEALGARDDVVLEEVLVSRRRLGLFQIRQVPFRLDDPIRVRCDWCDRQKEGVFLRQGVLEEPQRLLDDNVGRVLSGVADGLLAVARHLGVPVLVRVRVEQELGAVEAPGERLVVVVDGVEVPQLAHVVRLVPGVLHPQEEVVVVDALFHDLGVPPMWRCDVGDIVIVRGPAGPERGARWAAQRDGAVMLVVCETLVYNQRLPAVSIAKWPSEWYR